MHQATTQFALHREVPSTGPAAAPRLTAHCSDMRWPRATIIRRSARHSDVVPMPWRGRSGDRGPAGLRLPGGRLRRRPPDPRGRPADRATGVPCEGAGEARRRRPRGDDHGLAALPRPARALRPGRDWRTTGTDPARAAACCPASAGRSPTRRRHRAGPQLAPTRERARASGSWPRSRPSKLSPDAAAAGEGLRHDSAGSPAASRPAPSSSAHDP